MSSPAQPGAAQDRTARPRTDPREDPTMPDIDDLGPSHHPAEDDPDLEDLCDDNPHDDEENQQ